MSVPPSSVYLFLTCEAQHEANVHNALSLLQDIFAPAQSLAESVLPIFPGRHGAPVGGATLWGQGGQQGISARVLAVTRHTKRKCWFFHDDTRWPLRLYPTPETHIVRITKWCEVSSSLHQAQSMRYLPPPFTLSLNHGDRWGTTGLSIPLCCLPTSFFCLPCLLPPFTVPCRMVLARLDEAETCQLAPLYDGHSCRHWGLLCWEPITVKDFLYEVCRRSKCSYACCT